MTIVRNTVWDPSMAIKQMAASGPQMEMKRRVEWDIGVKVNDPMVRHPG